MLSMKARYALKALSRLAQADPGELLLTSDLAERDATPRKFLEAILRELRQHGIVDSKKGRGGGYALREPAFRITLARIIRAVDGPLAPVPCLSRSAYRRCAECPNEQTCGVRLVLADLHESTLAVLEGTTLADLVRRTSEAEDVRRHLPSYAI